ncbi:MAG: MT-A70 family methyltransferase [Nitrospiraceae bacterium]
MEPGYDVLLADPPWSYRNVRTGGSMKSGSLAKYQTLTVEQLCQMHWPLNQIVKPRSALFLWVTSPMKPEGLQVMGAWGYRYAATIYWDKTSVRRFWVEELVRFVTELRESRLGMGHWYRGQVEELLVGIRGGYPAFRCQERNIIREPSGPHSHKPTRSHELIEKATPGTRRLELFATQKRPGWDAVGIEIDGQDIREALQQMQTNQAAGTVSKEQDV